MSIIYNHTDYSGINSKDGICIFDTQLGKEVRTLYGHKDIINSAVFSPDGNYIASGGLDNKVIVWNVNTGSEIFSFNGAGSDIESIKFSNNSNYIICGGGTDNKTVRIWDVRKNRKVRDFEYSRPHSVCFSNDDKYAICAGGEIDKSIVFFDIDNGQMIKSISTSSVNSIDLKHEGNFLVCGTDSYKKTLEIWNFKENLKVSSLPGKKLEPKEAIFTLNGKSIINNNKYSGLFKSWNFINPTIVESISNIENFQYLIGFSKNGRYLLYQSKDKNSYNYFNISLYDIKSKETINTFVGHTDLPYTATFSPDEKYIASGGDDNKIIIWNIQTGTIYRTLYCPNRIYSIQFSPDGNHIMTNDKDKYGLCTYKNVRIWDVNTGKEQLCVIGNKMYASSIKYSPDGKIFSCGGINTINFYDSQNGNLLKTINDVASIKSHDISTDGKYMAAGCSDYIIKLWDLSSNKIIRTFSGHTGNINSVHFSPDGKNLVSTSEDGSIKIWDVATEKCLITRYDIPNSDDWVAVTPEGRFDGTEKGMNLLYYVKDLQVLPLSNFYEKFYTPNLIARVMSGDTETSTSQYTMESNFTLPPAVKILNPIDGSTATGSTATVTVEAIDQGGGIDEMLLYHNGKLVQTTQRGFKPAQVANEKRTMTYTVELLPGQNSFTASAFNTDRTESNPYSITVNYAGAQRTTTLHLFVVGVNQYKNAIYNLNYAQADAQAIKQKINEVSGGIYKDIKVYELYNENATKAGIEAVIEKIKATATPNDMFLFFYAGHGVMSEPEGTEQPKYYLVPYDLVKMTNSSLLSTLGISALELRDWCKNIKAQKQVILLDACQSGGAVETFAMRGAAEEKAVLQLGRSAGVVVMAGTGTQQFATEFKQLGHGVFTYSLLEGLNGKADGGTKDKKITVKELESFINDYIPELSKQYRGEVQYPNSYETGMDFPIGTIK